MCFDIILPIGCLHTIPAILGIVAVYNFAQGPKERDEAVTTTSFLHLPTLLFKLSAPFKNTSDHLQGSIPNLRCGHNRCLHHARQRASLPLVHFYATSPTQLGHHPFGLASYPRADLVSQSIPVMSVGNKVLHSSAAVVPCHPVKATQP